MNKNMMALFDLLAEDLVQRIRHGEATSADLSVARQFLKDNGIDASLQQSDPLLNLAKSLPFDNLEDVA